MYIFTSKCAPRHNGVHFFFSPLPRCLRARRFSKPTFRPAGATKHGKNTVFRDFPTFSRTCIFFRLTFSISELLLSCTAFSSLHIVGSLASKLPSIILFRHHQRAQARRPYRNGLQVTRCYRHLLRSSLRIGSLPLVENLMLCHLQQNVSDCMSFLRIGLDSQRWCHLVRRSQRPAGSG